MEPIDHLFAISTLDLPLSLLKNITKKFYKIYLKVEIILKNVSAFKLL